MTETEYQYAPLRIFDLQPGLDKKVQTISHPISAWTADWRDLAHNHEVRWPLVFVSAYEDGLQVFNMLDPTDPYTVAYYDTFGGPHDAGCCSDAYVADRVQDPRDHGIYNGAFGVQVRDADGLIVISDMTTGFWAFYLDGFDGWNGHGGGCRTCRPRSIGTRAPMARPNKRSPPQPHRPRRRREPRPSSECLCGA